MKRALVLTALLVFSCKGNAGTNAPEPAPSGVSPEQHAADEELREGLAPTCAGCHGSGTNKPFFASATAFADLLIYNKSYVTPGDPDNSELVRVLEGRGTTFKQMPVGGKSFAELEAAGATKITVAAVKEFIRKMQSRGPVVAAADPTAPLMRRLSAVQIERALYDQLGLERADFFYPDSNIARDPDLLPMRNPDQAIPQSESYIHSYARQRWIALGGANHLALLGPKNDPTPTFAQNINQIAQGWCRIAVNKPSKALFVHATVDDKDATPVRANIAYLYTRMLGLPATDAETEKLFALFTHYATAADTRVAWTSVCAALVRHPLWLSY